MMSEYYVIMFFVCYFIASMYVFLKGRKEWKEIDAQNAKILDLNERILKEMQETSDAFMKERTRSTMLEFLVNMFLVAMEDDRREGLGEGVIRVSSAEVCPEMTVDFIQELEGLIKKAGVNVKVEVVS